MVITSENIGFITSGCTVKKTSAILHYYSCLKKYLNTALFEKKQCSRVIALFQCAITNVWYIYYRERLILEGLGPYINNVDHFITECLYLIYITELRKTIWFQDYETRCQDMEVYRCFVWLGNHSLCMIPIYTSLVAFFIIGSNDKTCLVVLAFKGHEGHKAKKAKKVKK